MDARQKRIARYKDERRKQLLAQFGNVNGIYSNGKHVADSDKQSTTNNNSVPVAKPSNAGTSIRYSSGGGLFGRDADTVGSVAIRMSSNVTDNSCAVSNKFYRDCNKATNKQKSGNNQTATDGIRAGEKSTKCRRSAPIERPITVTAEGSPRFKNNFCSGDRTSRRNGCVDNLSSSLFSSSPVSSQSSKSSYLTSHRIDSSHSCKSTAKSKTKMTRSGSGNNSGTSADATTSPSHFTTPVKTVATVSVIEKVSSDKRSSPSDNSKIPRRVPAYSSLRGTSPIDSKVNELCGMPFNEGLPVQRAEVISVKQTESDRNKFTSRLNVKLSIGNGRGSVADDNDNDGSPCRPIDARNGYDSSGNGKTKCRQTRDLSSPDKTRPSNSGADDGDGISRLLQVIRHFSNDDEGIAQSASSASNGIVFDRAKDNGSSAKRNVAEENFDLEKLIRSASPLVEIVEKKSEQQTTADGGSDCSGKSAGDRGLRENFFCVEDDHHRQRLRQKEETPITGKECRDDRNDNSATERISASAAKDNDDERKTEDERENRDSFTTTGRRYNRRMDFGKVVMKKDSEADPIMPDEESSGDCRKPSDSMITVEKCETANDQGDHRSELIQQHRHHHRPSILKKKNEEPIGGSTVSGTDPMPASILKRKVSHELSDDRASNENRKETAARAAPPSQRQGILKKYSSLDETESLSHRRRSCSPDVHVSAVYEFKPILKTHRRSSFEELVRRKSVQSAPELQSILKRKSYQGGEPLDNPHHGILKRKCSQVEAAGGTDVANNNADNSAASVSSSSESSIETRLAAAVWSDAVKPILKNRSSSGLDFTADRSSSVSTATTNNGSNTTSAGGSGSGGGVAAVAVSGEILKPILKKKSVSLEPDDCSEDKPKKPILKASVRLDRSFSLESPGPGNRDDSFHEAKTVTIKPILKRTDWGSGDLDKRHSIAGLSARETVVQPSLKERPMSVVERIITLEHFLKQENAVKTDEEQPPTAHHNRNNERYRTQPITKEEIYVTNRLLKNKTSTSSFQMESVNNMKLAEDKMDGDEEISKQLAEETLDKKPCSLKRSNSVSEKASLFAKLDEEAKKSAVDSKTNDKNEKRSSTERKLRVKCAPSAGRFATQPVTTEEVQEAKRQNSTEQKPTDVAELDEDASEPSRLSIAERVKLFSQKLECLNAESTHRTNKRNGNARFKTQPITTEELLKAKNKSSVSAELNNDDATSVKSDDSTSSCSYNSMSCASESNQVSTNREKSDFKLTANASVNLKSELISRLDGIFKKSLSKKSSDASSNLSSSSNDLFSSDREMSSVSSSSSIAVSDCSANISENLSDSNRTKLRATLSSPLIRENSDVSNATDTISSSSSYCAEDSQKLNIEDFSAANEDNNFILKSQSASSVKDKVANKERSEHVSKVMPSLIRKSASFRHPGSRESKMINTEIDIIDDRKTLGARSSIAERLAALQRNGELEWKKRLSRLAPENDFSSITSVTETQEVLRKELMGVLNNSANRLNIDKNKDESLADRLGKLENATQGWKKRVEPSDAIQFSIAGKMAGNLSVLPPLASPAALDKKKRVPCPVRFKSRNYENQQSEIRSSPTSPEKSLNSSVTYNRCSSLPNGMTEDTGDKHADSVDHRIVNVPQIFDDNFSTFFGNVSQTLLKSSSSASVDKVFDIDLENIKTNTPSPLACRKNVVKVQRKHASSSVNPIKALASKGITKQEYSEIKTDIAERELKRINVEKLSKNSSLAIEVLAGLASKEDFTSVPLKKAGSPIIKSMLPYKPLMLIHVKGRRHVQSRLVEPTFKAINSGDSYILVTSNELYHWIGNLSNVIERSRSAEIAQHILTTHDLGCAADNVHTIIESSFSTINSRQEQKFWIHLGVSENEAASVKAAAAGHPDEDELFESSLISTNMVYEALEEELVPVEKFWGTIPKIEMLDPNKVLIFDFGAEMYVWMGKNVDLKRRKSSVRLAKELWDHGYNYTECDTCPITAFLMVGNCEVDLNDKRNSNERPSWCLQAKITQHMETILFREKFLDWPDFTRVIRAKGKDEDTEKQIDPSVNVKPCDVKEMLDYKPTEPDLQLEGNHLGRGVQYYDNELRRYYSITTVDVCVWHIAEYDSKELNKESFGQFHSGDSYVIRWLYSITFTGRELSGLPSRHSVIGRDRCVYFCWQGRDASLNEQGAAALLTVELDKEKGPQVRISQGYEPPAFCSLFNGQMVIYKNKRDRPSGKKWRLYICKGEIESEAILVEVSANIRQLRSRASLVLVNTEKNTIYVWHGVKSPNTVRKICMTVVTNLIDSAPPEFGLNSKLKTTVTEIAEGEEPSEFFEGVNNNSRKLYLSLLNEKDQYDKTPLLFHLTSAAGVLNAVPVQYPYYHQNRVSPYPFSQNDLYSVRQPALFLLDSGNELWLWQGWWPEQEKNKTASNSDEEADSIAVVNNHRGSAAIRWQAERRASMQTALDYWEKSRGNAEVVKAYLVWAGLEPLQFTNLFPDWDDRDDIAEINIKDGRKPGEILPVNQELARLTQSTYPLEQLLQRPLPDGVDPTKLEIYLAPQYFQEILKTTKEEFLSLPSWKQSNMKKAVGLF